MNSNKNHVRVLLTIASSGTEPFLEIERKGQAETFAKNCQEDFGLLWFQGTPNLDEKFTVVILEELLSRIHRDRYLDQPAFEFIFLNRRIQLRRRPSGFIPTTDSGQRSFFRLKINWARVFAPEARVNLPFLLLNIALRVIYRRISTTGPSHWGARVVQGVSTRYFLHPIRTLDRLRYCVNRFSFDYILLTTSTCYVDFSRLARIVELLPATGCYAGDRLQLSSSAIAGNSILLSRDVAEQIVKFDREFRLDLADDMGIADLVNKRNLAQMIEVQTVNLASDFLITGSLPVVREGEYLYRCKMEEKTQRAELVVEAMKKLHNALQF